MYFFYKRMQRMEPMLEELLTHHDTNSSITPSKSLYVPIGILESKKTCITFVINLVVGKHVIKGVVELIGYLLDLQLLPVDLILNVVNPVVELGDVHLAVLITGFSMLQ